jgi:hypothetical protein
LCCSLQRSCRRQQPSSLAQTARRKAHPKCQARLQCHGSQQNPGPTLPPVLDSGQSPAIAAKHQQAAGFLQGLGLGPSRVAWALSRWPQLGVLEPGELRARVDAAAAAFGGGLSAAALLRRLRAAPKVLTLAPGDIAAAHARLAVLGLTSDEAAGVLAAQPALLLASASKLRSTAENLQLSYELSPQQLRALIILFPLCLRRSCGMTMAPGSRRSLRELVAKQFQGTDGRRLAHVIADITSGRARVVPVAAGKAGMASSS